MPENVKLVISENVKLVIPEKMYSTPDFFLSQAW